MHRGVRSSQAVARCVRSHPSLIRPRTAPAAQAWAALAVQAQWLRGPPPAGKLRPKRHAVLDSKPEVQQGSGAARRQALTAGLLYSSMMEAMSTRSGNSALSCLNSRSITSSGRSLISSMFSQPITSLPSWLFILA